jgi:hypothetical protein
MGLDFRCHLTSIAAPDGAALMQINGATSGLPHVLAARRVGQCEETASMDKKTQINLWYAIAAVLALILTQNWRIERQQIDAIPHSEFKSLVGRESGGRASRRQTNHQQLTGAIAGRQQALCDRARR